MDIKTFVGGLLLGILLFSFVACVPFIDFIKILPVKLKEYDEYKRIFESKQYKKHNSMTNRGTVNNIKSSIQMNGSQAVPRIPVRVHHSQALVVDGHHRLQAFRELGYNRVPIKYIHENQIYKYGRTLEELINEAYK